jgi:hypothetical protein
LIVTPNEICGILFHDCGSPINPFADSWPLKMPDNKPPYQSPTPPQVTIDNYALFN